MKKTGLVCIELSLLFLRFSLQKNNIVSNVISWKTVVSVQSRFETSRFDTNSSSEIARKFPSLQVKFSREQEKRFG